MNGFGAIGDIRVETVSHRGFKPEEIVERALDKIIYVGSNSHPAIREQAEAFRDSIRKVIIFYMYEAIRSDHVTIANRLREAGYPELVELLDV